ncbi:rCG61987, partial [Rattus norvegicus]
MFKAPSTFSFRLAPSTKCKTEGLPKVILRTIDSLYYCSSQPMGHEPLGGCISDILHIRCIHCNLNSSKMTVAMKIILQSGVTTTVEGYVQLYNKYEASLGSYLQKMGEGREGGKEGNEKKKGNMVSVCVCV